MCMRILWRNIRLTNRLQTHPAYPISALRQQSTYIFPESSLSRLDVCTPRQAFMKRRFTQDTGAGAFHLRSSFICFSTGGVARSELWTITVLEAASTKSTVTISPSDVLILSPGRTSSMVNA